MFCCCCFVCLFCLFVVCLFLFFVFVCFVLFVVFLRRNDTLSEEKTLSILFCLPSEKGENFKRGLICREANRKS